MTASNNMPAYHFSQIDLSADGSSLTARCTPGADLACFAGHFPGLPMMPAIAQIAMLQALIREHSGWSAHTISAGKRLKFAAPIQPGNSLYITLQACGDTVRFSIEHTHNPSKHRAGSPTSPTSSGTLTLNGAAHD